MTTSTPPQEIELVDAVLTLLTQQGYAADRSLATALFLALRLQRPLLLEGEPGVGKTELAKALSAGLGRRLVRLQCYEGLDVAQAVYEWDYPRQMMEIRLAEAAGQHDRQTLEGALFSRRFLIRRPLLQAIDPDDGLPVVLLIDELDRADEPFEAFLLEALSDYQVTIPELGLVRAPSPPAVLITSNRTRELHDAIKRRCLYHWLDYPSLERERAILRLKAPDAPAVLSRQVTAFVRRLRSLDLFKPPGIAETIDWSRALTQMDRQALDPGVVEMTLGVLLKHQEDLALVRDAGAERLLEESRAAESGGGV